ncbi:hypothetical protein GF323_05820 [Candidatus Woesearchaeota archaeon]|nr:hypothetical protein [Candidatus Woesearchaeota archaeon]
MGSPERNYLNDAAAVMRANYERQIALAMDKPTHEMFAQTGIYNQIDDIVLHLSEKYEESDNFAHKALDKLKKAAKIVGVPALSGAITGAYCGYGEESMLHGAEIGSFYCSLAGATVWGIGIVIEDLVKGMSRLSSRLWEYTSKQNPEDLIIRELSEKIKAIDATVNDIENILDFHFLAKRQILKLIQYPETKSKKRPISLESWS